MASKKIQLYTDRDKTIEASPETSANCVILSDGNDLQKVLDNDLTNPTVVHEETSFKVGVGDIDVSSSVVDGEVGRMVIKGKTYQNILPEPSTHVLTNNKEMFKVNEGLDTNVEIVDGVSKSAILSGSTERRVSKNLFNGRIRNNADINSATGQESQTGSRTISLDYTPVLPSTEYTFTRPINTKQMGYRLYRSDKSFIKFQALGNNLSATFTTTSDTAYFKFIDEANTLTEGYQLELGSVATEYEPYFEPHLISCKMPVLSTTGKNLYNKETVVIGKYVNTDGVIVSATTDVLSDYIRVKPNTKYAFKAMDSRVSAPYGCMAFYDKDKGFISRTTTSHSLNQAHLTPSDCYYVRVWHNGYTQCENTVSDCMFIETENSPSVITSHESYKTNILHTPEEVVLRSLPNGVCDTLNLNTGEYVQRIGEVVLDGSSDENWNNTSNAGNVETLTQFNIGTAIFNGALPKTASDESVVRGAFIQNMFGIQKASVWTYQEGEACAIHMPNPTHNSQAIQAKVLRSRLSSQDVAGWRALLQNTPWVLQYELATPIVKTVDLSSSGNWEKIIFNGSEGWSKFNIADLTTTSQFYLQLPNFKSGVIICNEFPYYSSRIVQNGVEGVSGSGGNGLNIWLNILNSKIGGNTVEKFKQYLSQNPLTVWYQTTTHQDSTQVKQPIFFKDGHVQLSSGTDNSLIPTLDYQAKTSNSYVMDLMKTNTLYTMKCSNPLGGYTIDGIVYNFVSNRTFNSPSTFTNKLLVATGSATDLMIIEGDVTSKAIPYFKGIKSAFEDESKIEVLSTNHNLWTGVDNYTNNGAIIILKDENECVFEHHVVNNGIRVKVSDYEYQVITMSYDFEILDGKALNVGGHNRHQTKAYYIDGVKVGTSYHNGYVTTYEKNRVYHVDHVVHINLPIAEGANGDREYIGIEPNRYSADTPTYCKMRVTNFQITLGDVVKEYKVPKSNSTKIPLLSPLRSLPNGVYDELIIDRMKKKATLIQRVGVGVLDGTQIIHTNTSTADANLYQPFYCENVFGNMAIVPHNVVTVRCDNLLACSSSTGYRNLTVNAMYQYTDSSARLAGQITKKDLGAKNVRQWFEANPTTVYYQLATPVVTEIDLENFPFVYKDGHIFLNSEIAPVVEIDYSINQSQQIQSNNETLQRHELDILDLDNLIVSFVNAEYNLRLLKFDMELSMMTLAE